MKMRDDVVVGEDANKPSIILITVDCLRADHINHMKKILRRRNVIMFKNAVSNATYTGLSVPSMLSSSYPPLDSPKPTIAEYLREEGYSTAAFVPNALLLDQRYRRLRIENGFDVYRNYLKEDLTRSIRRAFNKFLTGFRDGLRLFSKYFPKFLSKALLKASSFTPISVWLPYLRGEKVLSDAKEWFKNTEKPAFVWIHLMDAHEPYFPPEKYTSIDKNTIAIINKRSKFARTWLPREDVKILHQLYIDSIRYLDEIIDKFLDDITDKDTVVIISADHGQQFLEHGGIGHLNWNMYDEQLHIPLLILNYKENAQTREELVSLLDVAPTIAYIADINPPTFVGRNLMSDFKRNPVFFAGYDEKWNVLYGIRTEKWKIFRGKNGWELYNLEEDKKEKENVYQNHPEIVVRLKGMLVEILERKSRVEEERKKLKEVAKRLGVQNKNN